ncbi:TnsA-like heteromeric transposase endonuclease subunit [Gordonia malaquae]|uniref:TnsA-like heteromeric transposase endonuclease subunit n=1 Tax=Gordonia malaquae TaxID=410332 RepID=UPI0030C78D61
MSALTEDVWKSVPDEALFRRMQTGLGYDRDAVVETAKVRFITEPGREVTQRLVDVDPSDIDGGQQVRTIPKYRGRKNYSGWLWMATASRTVPYESLLERTRILIADYDTSVVGVTSQGIELTGSADDGKAVSRYPDLLLLRRDAPPLVVDVTSRDRLHKPKRVASFTWTGAAMTGAGWEYEVWCDADRTALANLTLLSGYRRSSVIALDVVADIMSAEPAGTLQEIEDALALRHRRMDVVPAVRYAMWHGVLDFDIGQLIDTDTELAYAGSRHRE